MDGLLIFIGIVIVIGFIALSFYLKAKRRKEILEWASANQLTFSEYQDDSIDERYPDFGCLTEGSNRYGYNHLTGLWNGLGFHGFDYHYETYSTDSDGNPDTDHHYFSAVVIESKVSLERLFIRPEGFFDKVTEFFGLDDIDFESSDFSDKFYVKAADKRWAYDVLHQRTMQFLLDSPRYTIQFVGDHVIAYQGSKFSMQEYGTAGDVVTGILERLPDYVVEQQAGKI